MTASSSYGSRLTIKDFCLLALQSAGLRSMSQGTEDAQWARDFSYAKKRLEMIVNSIVLRGKIARAVSFTTVQLSVGVRAYDLDARALDVLGDAVYIDPGEDVAAANGETPVTQVSSEAWHLLSNKGTSGRPEKFWLDRSNDVLAVNLWHIPSEAGSIRFRVARKLADSTDGSATLDLEEYWDLAISKRLEAELMAANSMMLPLVMDRRMEAEKLWDEAISMANECTVRRARVDHRTAWR